MLVEFVFSDDTLLSLSKTLASFPPVEIVKSRPLIKFGQTIDNVSLENLESLLRVCEGKVTIDLNGTDLKKIFMSSRRANLITTSDVKSLSSEDKQYLFDLYKQKSYQLLFFILNNNNINLDAKDIESKKNFATIAYES